MAANPKTFRIVATRMAGEATRVLELEDLSGEGFALGGGKYVIVHTGLVNADRAVKRAYSLMPVAGSRTAEIAVKRLDGLGARAMHELPLGATRDYSGPWGKLTPEDGLAERTLLVATDTGITTALGLVERVLPPADVLATATADALVLARGPRAALAAAKSAIRAAILTPGPEGLERETQLFRDLFGTPDQREGMRAFLEKREPRFGDTPA